MYMKLLLKKTPPIYDISRELGNPIPRIFDKWEKSKWILDDNKKGLPSVIFKMTISFSKMALA